MDPNIIPAVSVAIIVGLIIGALLGGKIGAIIGTWKARVESYEKSAISTVELDKARISTVFAEVKKIYAEIDAKAKAIGEAVK